MYNEPSNYALILDSIKFFCWLIGAICSSAVLLLGIYLKLYVKQVLQEHSDLIQGIIATTYVRRDLHDEQLRALRDLYIRAEESSA